MPRVPDLPCAGCGKMMWRGTTSLPEGLARCRPCRRADWEHGTRRGYRVGMCRCDECRRWARESMREYSAEIKARDGVTLRVKYRKTPDVFCAECGDRLRFGGGGTPEGVEPRCVKCSRKRAYIPRDTRMAVYERDDYACQLCGGKVEPFSDQASAWYPTLDHIVPVSLGGNDDIDNLRTAHRWCNGVRGVSDPHGLFEEAS